jgi:hypothetical protein
MSQSARYTGPVIGLIVIASWVGRHPAIAEDRGTPKRMVLVELYTSQGCDMCPAAEEILGKLAAQEKRIVPIAFHVDYFNQPWKDVFSDSLYTRRQMVYNQVYIKSKSPKYGLNYTPMLMIDGQQAVNGRDRDSAVVAIREALSRKPTVNLDVNLVLAADSLSGKASVRVSPRSPRAMKSPLLLCAVLREDGVVTDIPSGENAGKALVARYPARRTQFTYIQLDDDKPATKDFDLRIEPDWNRSNLRLAVFVQDKFKAVVHQAADIAWQSTTRATSKPSETSSSR